METKPSAFGITLKQHHHYSEVALVWLTSYKSKDLSENTCCQGMITAALTGLIISVNPHIFHRFSSLCPYFQLPEIRPVCLQHSLSRPVVIHSKLSIIMSKSHMMKFYTTFGRFSQRSIVNKPVITPCGCTTKGCISGGGGSW